MLFCATKALWQIAPNREKGIENERALGIYLADLYRLRIGYFRAFSSHLAPWAQITPEARFD